MEFTGEFMSDGIVGKKCSFNNCKNKVVVILRVDEVVKGLPIQKLYPVCKVHLDKIEKGECKE